MGLGFGRKVNVMEGRCRMEAVPEAKASGAALSAFCCPLFCWPFWCYFRFVFFGQHNCPVPAAWAALNESKSCYDSMAFPCRLP